MERMLSRKNLYAYGVSELQQSVLSNLESDILLGISLLAISVFGLYRLAKFWKVSVLPFLVLLPSFLVAGLVLYFPLSPLYLPSDGEFYQSWGYSMAAAWLSGEPMVSPQALWPGKGLWPLIIGGFSAIAGPVTVTLIVFNAVVLVLTSILLQKATFLLGGFSPRWSMVIVYLSSGPFVLWGPSLLRESLFWLGVAFGVLAVSYSSLHRYGFALLSVGLSALVLLGIRPDAGIVLAYGFVGVLLFLFGVVGDRRSLAKAAITSLVLLFLVFSFPIAFDSVREGTIDAKTILTANEALSAEDVATAFVHVSAGDPPSSAGDPPSSAGDPPSSAGDPGFCDRRLSETPLSVAVLCRAMANLPYTFFGPFYWEYRLSAIWFVAGASTLHFLALIGLATHYVVISTSRRWHLLAVLAVAAASMLMFSSILTNYGILIRFRAATEIMLIPLALNGALELLARLNSSRGKVRLSRPPPA